MKAYSPTAARQRQAMKAFEQLSTEMLVNFIKTREKYGDAPQSLKQAKEALNKRIKL